MSELFFSSFTAMAGAMAQILIIVIAAGLLVRKGIFKDEYLKGLSELTVNVLLPTLIFAKTLKTFKPEEHTTWWLIPLIGMSMALGGLALGALFSLKKLKTKQYLLTLSGIQNSGYLVLPVGQIVFPEQFDEFALYVFLFIMGFNPILWSLGKFFATASEELKFSYKQFITPPLVANIGSVILVLIGVNKFIPDIIVNPIDLIGSATVPVATFILGATLGSISIKQLAPTVDIIKVVSVKLFLIPAITILILYSLNINISNPLLCSLLVIEAAAAPAANIIVMIRKYGGPKQYAGSIMLICYLLNLVTMPFWIALWNIIR